MIVVTSFIGAIDLKVLSFRNLVSELNLQKNTGPSNYGGHPYTTRDVKRTSVN